jgi:uncharacterized membrane protein YecN with MAPEG domain
MIITPFYAALLALLFVKLTLNVIKTRRRESVAIGDGNNPALQRAIGVHNNFAQYVPISLLLIAFLELQAAPNIVIHMLGLSLLVSRCMHAYGLAKTKENFKIRTISMVATISIILAAAIYLIISTGLNAAFPN